MAGTQGEQLVGGSKQAAISNICVRMLSDYTGRGPTKARAHIEDDVVTIVLAPERRGRRRSSGGSRPSRFSGRRAGTWRVEGGGRMPKTTKGGKPKQSELPSTLQRSSEEAQRTWAKAHDGAVEQYGEGQRAHRTAYSALKHKFEKRGDRWVKKKRKGPSDPRAKDPKAREGRGKSYGGVDVEGSSRDELYERAKQLGVDGRSSMSKSELAEAIARKQ